MAWRISNTTRFRCILCSFLLLVVCQYLIYTRLIYFWKWGDYFSSMFFDTSVPPGVSVLDLNLSSYHQRQTIGNSVPIMDPCQLPPPNRVGRIAVHRTVPSWGVLVQRLAHPLNSSNNSTKTHVNSTTTEWPFLSTASDSHSAIWQPVECQSDQMVAIILPYRNRDTHLRVFLQHMHPFLRHQQITYTIFVVEQLGNTSFNRASLFNIGFLESKNVAPFDCFIFHDVDLLPEDDRNYYRCGPNPIHLSVAVNKFNYRLPYEALFGGASALSRNQFTKIHGFSNAFFGWGGEDDDMWIRISYYGYKVQRYKPEYGRYIMVSHNSDPHNAINPLRLKLLANSKARFGSDGVEKTLYQLVTAEPRYDGLVYWVSVHIPENEIKKQLKISQ